MANTDTPFNLSFDELMAQLEQNPNGSTADTPSTPAPEAPAGELSFEELAARAMAQAAQSGKVVQSGAVVEADAPAEEPVKELSFEEMVAQAQGQMAQAPAAPLSFEALAEKARQDAGMAPTEESKEAEAAGESAVEDPATGEPAVETKAEKPATEEPEVAEPVIEEPRAEEPAIKESETEKPEPESDFGMNPPENTETETQAAEMQKKPKRSRKKKVQTAEAPAAEPVKDVTSDYLVEIPGVTAAPESEAPMGALFTKDEVAALRADIRAFVRRELKLAMVEALKEVLHDFAD